MIELGVQGLRFRVATASAEEESGWGGDLSRVLCHDGRLAVMVGDYAGRHRDAKSRVGEVFDVASGGWGTPAWRGWRHGFKEAEGYLFRTYKASALVAAAVLEIGSDGKLVGASVGDCRALCYEGEEEPRDLTDGQNRNPLLGRGADLMPIESHIAPGGLIVLATDGLWRYVHQMQVWTMVRSFGIEAANILVDAVKLPNGELQGDVAVVVVEVG